MNEFKVGDYVTANTMDGLVTGEVVEIFAAGPDHGYKHAVEPYEPYLAVRQGNGKIKHVAQAVTRREKTWTCDCCGKKTTYGPTCDQCRRAALLPSFPAARDAALRKQRRLYVAAGGK